LSTGRVMKYMMTTIRMRETPPMAAEIIATVFPKRLLLSFVS
jgi:hypothetical protein